MNLTIFGGTGFVGRRLVERALEAGHTVRVSARSPEKLGVTHERLEVVGGVLSDLVHLRAVLTGADAVLSAVGLSKGTPTARPADGLAQMLSAMREASVRRWIGLSGAAIPFPGDPPLPLPGRVINALIRLGEGEGAREKFRERDLLLASELDWTVLRPTRIVDAPGTPRITLDRPAGVKTPREGLVEVMLAQLLSTEYLRKAPYVAGGIG